MQLVFHLGAHCTDNASLVESLCRSREVLANDGVALPGRESYLPLLDEAASGRATPDLRTRLLGTIPAAREAARAVFSCEDFIGHHGLCVAEGGLYPKAAERIGRLAGLLPGDPMELHMAIRSPATFLPTLIGRGDRDCLRHALDGASLDRLRWSDLVERMRDAAPDAPITIWCDEDVPLIWPEALDAVAGAPGRVPLRVQIERLGPMLTEEGARRLTMYLAKYPPKDAETRRNVVTSFLNQFGRREAIEMDLDMPGWSAATIDRLADLYEEDVERIARMDGVRLLAP